MMSWSFGIALASLVAAFFLGDTPQSDHAAFTVALHRSCLTLGALTILSSLLFRRLRPDDGNTVSGRMPGPLPG